MGQFGPEVGYTPPGAENWTAKPVVRPEIVNGTSGGSKGKGENPFNNTVELQSPVVIGQEQLKAGNNSLQPGQEVRLPGTKKKEVVKPAFVSVR